MKAPETRAGGRHVQRESGQPPERPVLTVVQKYKIYRAGIGKIAIPVFPLSERLTA